MTLTETTAAEVLEKSAGIYCESSKDYEDSVHIGRRMYEKEKTKKKNKNDNRDNNKEAEEQMTRKNNYQNKMKR